MKLYRYVGPKRIADRVGVSPPGKPIHSTDDVRAWIQSSGQQLSAGTVTATFVVDAHGVLVVADRRSEHVACARGQPVQCAGEITFEIGRIVKVEEVSNQSTGYCPEPDSWLALDTALKSAGLEHPDGFTLSCQFRWCSACNTITIIKNYVFQCSVCEGALPTIYNCQSSERLRAQERESV